MLLNYKKHLDICFSLRVLNGDVPHSSCFGDFECHSKSSGRKGWRPACEPESLLCGSAGEPEGGKTSDPQTPTNSFPAEDTLAFALQEEDETVLTSVVCICPNENKASRHSPVKKR